MNPCPRRKGDPRPTTRVRQIEVGGGVTDEQDEGLARLTDLDVAWGFELHAFLGERSQETPAAGNAGNLHARLQERSQETPVTGDAVDRTTEKMESSQGGAVDASSVPAGRTEMVKTMDSSQGGAVDAPAVPAGRAEKWLRRISSLRHRPRERRRSPRGPVGEGSSRAQ